MDQINTELLVIGGGVAGCFAAIKAKENNIDNVIIVDKGYVGNSGCSKFAAGSFKCFIPEEDDYDLWFSKAVEEGAKAVMCASTGNTSASAAAYSARCGLDCFVLIPKGAIALGKLAQALMHGAKVIAVEVKATYKLFLKLVRNWVRPSKFL